MAHPTSPANLQRNIVDCYRTEVPQFKQLYFGFISVFSRRLLNLQTVLWANLFIVLKLLIFININK